MAAEDVTDRGWFQGDEPRTESEARFVGRLRELAPGWSVPGLLPEESGCLTVLTPFLVQVKHPSLRGAFGLTELQVGYWPPTTNGLRLEGEWGNDYLLDNGGDETDLRVQGVSAEPEYFAEAAATWLEAQLLRPIERLDWRKGDRVMATRIRLAGGGQTLARRGSWLRGKGERDRTIRLN